jgi:hypothetical protein
MLHAAPDPKNGPDKKEPRFSDPDMTPRREGGDDALAETNPTDARADEKVIVNEQESNRTVNSATAADDTRSEMLND